MVVQSTRHFLVRVEQLNEAPEPIVLASLTSAVRGSVSELFGDFGLGCVARTLQAKNYCAAAGYVLVRSPRKCAANVRAAIVSVRFVNKRAVRLSVVHAAGSQRTARRAMLTRLERALAAHERRPAGAALGLCEDGDPPAAQSTPASASPTATSTRQASDIRRMIRDLTAEMNSSS